jgi:cytoskeleton protein RodZ
MSEINEASGALPDDSHTSEAEPEPKVSAGQLLRTARLASGMHIGALSLALKVPVKKLEALESDDWAQLPDAVFVRALATSVCRQIKTDKNPILAALPQSKSFRDIDQGSKIAIQPSFHSPSDSKWHRLHLRLSMPMIAGAAVFLLAALLLIFLPDFAKQQNSKQTEVIEKIEAISAAPLPVAPAVGAMSSSSTSTPVTPAMPAALMAAPAPAPAIKPITSAPLANLATPVVTPSAMPSILRLTAKGEVWVQVKDSKGLVLVQRNLQSKEVVNVSGIPPLSVVLGRVNEIESVAVRGKPFDLAPVSSENIARFEVK